jgi:hypothetical protein
LPNGVKVAISPIVIALRISAKAQLARLVATASKRKVRVTAILKLAVCPRVFP